MSQKPSGLKAPSKIRQPTGLPQPKSGSNIPTSGSGSSRAQSALEKSVRAAGLPSNFAEHYASEVLKQYPGPELSAVSDPADGYKIGDRVWVGGTKPGTIAYIGETQFAPGEWAGVVLNDAVGKNDGSVAGVRYFQCELKHGVFSRLTKLSREPSSTTSSSPADSTTQQIPPARLPASNGAMLPPGVACMNNPSKLRSASGASHASSRSESTVIHIKLNDRVLVGGTKTGVLRYLGPTDFAKGDWAGVELDEPMGKNDGAVAGKRYFQCVPLFGLFAPVQKVVKAMGVTAPATRRASLNKCSLSALGGGPRSRSGSQESISSIGSSISNVSGRGRTPSRPTKSRPTNLNLSAAATSGLQKALKEKEEHVEQLLRERDLERSEVARAAAQVDKAENELMTIKSEYNHYMEEREVEKTRLQTLVDQLTNEKKDTVALLEEEKRKVEDLQFTIEEETITKDELEEQTAEHSRNMGEIEKQLQEARANADGLAQQVTLHQAQGDKSKTVEQAMIADLNSKLEQARSQISALQAAKLAEGTSVNEELKAKMEKIRELEDALASTRHCTKDMEERIAELEEELKSSQSRQHKQQEAMDEMTSKLSSGDSRANNLTTEVMHLKSQVADLERQLIASGEKSNQLEEDKSKLEQRLSELVQNSGNSSEQLGLLSEQLLEKDRKLVELQDALSNSTQRIGKLQETIEMTREVTEREAGEAAVRHAGELTAATNRAVEAAEKAEKAAEKVVRTKETYEKDLEEVKVRRDMEIAQLNEQLLQKEEQCRQEQTKSSEAEQLKAVVEQHVVELEALKTRLAEAETTRAALTVEKDSVAKDRDQLQLTLDNTKGSDSQKIADLTEEMHRLQEEAAKFAREEEKQASGHRQLEAQHALLLQEKSDFQVALQEKQAKVQEAIIEVERLQKVCNTQTEQLQRSQNESEKWTQDVNRLQAELVSFTAKYTEMEERVTGTEKERDSLKSQLQQVSDLKDERKKLLDERVSLEEQIKGFKESESRMAGDHLEETTTLQKMLDATMKTLDNSGEKVQKLSGEVTQLKAELTRMRTYEQSVVTLTDEKQSLEKRLQNLELIAIPANGNVTANSNMSTSENVVELQSENNNLTSQVDFLNSVIADLQRKNEAFQARLEVMESGGITNGNNSSDASDVHRKIPAPRLFCDICDVFDLHDTEDCPKQEMSDSPEMTHYHGDRTEQRPFCDICEVFGHWTAQCDDEQTF